jgi:hypothetical protein
MSRPRPPEQLLGVEGALAPAFAPAPDLLDWMLATFVEEGAPLWNEEHMHLAAARIGVLWTSAANSRHGKMIAGQAEFRPPGGSMGKWARARAQAQLHGWFGGEVDFLLTFYAQYAADCSDIAFCALCEHELYHCGQAKDEFGQPKFVEGTGLPVFCMRGHDVEEFVGVVKRYGAYSVELQAMATVASQAPEFGPLKVAEVCGTCHA